MAGRGRQGHVDPVALQQLVEFGGEERCLALADRGLQRRRAWLSAGAAIPPLDPRGIEPSSRSASTTGAPRPTSSTRTSSSSADVLRPRSAPIRR